MNEDSKLSRHTFLSGRLDTLSGSLIGALFTLLTGVLLFYAWRAWDNPSEYVSTAARTSIRSDVALAETVPLPDPAAGWKTYRNEHYGFQVMIPAYWEPSDAAATAEAVSFDTLERQAILTRLPIEGYIAPVEVYVFDRDALTLQATKNPVQSTPPSSAFTEERDVMIGTQLFRQMKYVGSSTPGGGPRWYYIPAGQKTETPPYAFSALEDAQSVLLSMLRSFEPLSAATASSTLLKAASFRYLRSSVAGGSEVVGNELRGAIVRETVRVQLPVMNEAIVAADIDPTRTKLLYSTAKVVRMRELDAGTDSVLFSTGTGDAPDGSIPLTSLQFSPDGSFVSFVFSDRVHTRISIMNLKTHAFSWKDISVGQPLFLWVDARRFLFVSDAGLLTLADVSQDGIRSFQSDVLSDVKAMVPYAVAFTTDRTRLAVLAVGPAAASEQASAGTRHAFLFLIDPQLADVGTTRLLETVDLGLPITEAAEHPASFGLAFSPDGQRIILSVEDRIWVAGAGRLETFRPDPSVTRQGRVLGTLSSGELLMNQSARNPAGDVIGGRLLLLDPEGEIQRFASSVGASSVLLSSFVLSP